MFLFRAAFWLTIVVLLIPADPKSGVEAPSVTVVQAFVAARSTIADLSGFCDRNPDVCVTGGAAFRIIGQKAENGVRMIYDYIDGNGGDKAGAGTLTEEDMLPAWKNPSGGRA